MTPYHDTLPDLLARSAPRLPQKVAIKDARTALSFEQLAAEVDRLAAYLLATGLGREERVGILCERTTTQVVALLAVAQAGGAFVVLAPTLKPAQVAHIVGDCEIRRLLLAPALLERLAELPAPGPRLLLLDYAPTEQATTTRPAADETPRWSALRTAAAGPSRPARPVLANDLANISYTSGSTGRPKGVVLPHRNLVDGARIVSGYLELSAADKLLALLPFNFDYGLNQLTSALLHGCTLVLADYFLPRDLMELLAREEITGWAGLRPIWLGLFRGRFALAAADIPPLPALRYLTNTGGRMPETVLAALRRAFPQAAIYLMYGLTEAFRSTFLPPSELDRRPTSIGKAIPGVEILVVDADGREVPAGVEGELVHRGALVARGYWNDPEATTRVFRPNPRFAGRPHLSERVVYSGDIVRRDEEGFLYFVTRGDAQIKSAGHRVAPQEIEEAVLAQTGASQAIAFGVEHDDERDIVIVVVLEGDADELDLPALRRRLRRALPAYMVPGRLFCEDALPRTASGKIDRAGRAALEARYREQSDEDA